MDNITHRGKWFLPEDTENRVLGTLTFSSEGGIDLELDGAFVEEYRGEFLRPDIILGDTYSGKRVTLYLCNQHDHQRTKSGDVISKFSAIYMLEGDHFTVEDELVFHRSISSYFNLGLWLKRSGFYFDDDVDKDAWSILYKEPKPIRFELDGNVDGRIDVDIHRSSPSNPVFETKAIKQRTVVCLEYKQAQPFGKILKDIRHFQNFLTLAIYEPTYPNHVRLQHNERTHCVGSKDFPITVHLYFSPPYFKPVKDKHQYIFRYRDVQDDFPAIIRKWYALNETIDDPFYLLFGSFYNVTNALESQFLDLARAIETFHRRLRNNQERSPEEHKKMINNIVDRVDESDKKWLKQRLAFSNEPTLHKRLEDITEEVKSSFIDRVISDYEQFVRDVKNTRNFQTHFSPKLEKKAKRGEELILLTKRLRLILVTAILQEIGLPQDQVGKLLERNQHRLFYYLISKE